VQTAKTSGLPDKTVRGIIEQLADTAGAKTDAALDDIDVVSMRTEPDAGGHVPAR
jgi:hypothetical protein